MAFLFGQVLVVGGNRRPYIGGEFLSCTRGAHQLGLHPFVGYSRVDLGRLVDILEGLGEELIVPLDGHDSPVGPVISVAAQPLELF